MVEKRSSGFVTSITGENNQILADPEMTIRNAIINIDGNGNTLVFGKGCTVQNVRFVISGDNNHVEVNDKCKLSGSVSVGRGGRFIVGARSTFSRVEVIVDHVTVQVGNDCMFSTNTVLRSSDSHPIYDIDSRKQINESRTILIGDYVWVGRGATVMKGVSIGTGSIVGLGSIVTHDVPSFCAVAGIPGTVVRQNVIWTRHFKKGILDEDSVAMKYLNKRATT